MSDEIATLPLSAHLSIVRKFIERERGMRNTVLKGATRLKGIEDAENALRSLAVIEQAARKP